MIYIVNHQMRTGSNLKVDMIYRQDGKGSLSHDTYILSSIRKDCGVKDYIIIIWKCTKRVFIITK